MDGLGGETGIEVFKQLTRAQQCPTSIFIVPVPESRVVRLVAITGGGYRYYLSIEDNQLNLVFIWAPPPTPFQTDLVKGSYYSNGVFAAATNGQLSGVVIVRYGQVDAPYIDTQNIDVLDVVVVPNQQQRNSEVHILIAGRVIICGKPTPLSPSVLINRAKGTAMDSQMWATLFSTLSQLKTVVLKKQIFSRAGVQEMYGVLRHVVKLQKWIEDLLSRECCRKQDVGDILKLLERCAQVLRLITFPNETDNFEWGCIYGLTLFQLVSTIEGQDKIERMLVIFASQGEFTPEKHEIADELKNKCSLFYSNTVITTFNAFKTANDALTDSHTVQTCFIEAAKSWRSPILVTGEPKPRRRVVSSLQCAARKGEKEAREAGSISALAADILIQLNHYGVAAQVSYMAIKICPDDDRTQSILLNCISQFYSKGGGKDGNKWMPFYYNLIAEMDVKTRHLVEEYCYCMNADIDTVSSQSEAEIILRIIERLHEDKRYFMWSYDEECKAIEKMADLICGINCSINLKQLSIIHHRAKELMIISTKTAIRLIVGISTLYFQLVYYGGADKLDWLMKLAVA